MDLYAVAERWPDGIWHVVAHSFSDDPIDAILIVAGSTAELLAKGAAAHGWAAQAATCDRGSGDDPSIIRILDVPCRADRRGVRAGEEDDPMKRTTIAALMLSGCALDWTGPGDDLDADQVDDDGAELLEQADQPEAYPDGAGDDQVDDQGPEASDEDDGWTDPAGEDGGDESAGELCIETCNQFWTPERIGRCDDGGPGSDSDDCDYGTDCSDCGPRPAGEP